MVEINEVNKWFVPDLQVLKDVSLHITRGETLILLGKSGSGKTTLLKTINRLIEPESGSIQINGTDTRDVAPEKLRRNIGYVIQQSGLFPHLSVRDNISVVPRLLRWNKVKIGQQCEALMSLMELDHELLNKRPGELSGGQQQRVGIARALAADPELLLMDEPFGALDPITRKQIQLEFKRLTRKLSKTVVMVTHDIEEALLLGDRICLIEAGSIQQVGTPATLVFSPKNRAVSDFFASNLFAHQLQAIHLIDIVKYLPACPITTSKSTLSLQDSLWDCLSNGHLGDILHIPVSESETMAVALPDLWQAFFGYKQTKEIG